MLDALKGAQQAYGIFVFIVLFTLNLKVQINVFEQQRQQQNNQIQQNNNKAIHNQSSQDNYNQVEEAKAELKNTKKVSNSKFRFLDYNSPNNKLKANIYIKAYNELNAMLSTDTATSIKRAVYIVENSYLQNNLPYNQYLKLIQNNVELVK